MSSAGRFTRREKLVILAFILAGIAGTVTYVLLYDSAFPTASLDLQITRSDALKIGERFLKSQGLDVRGYRRVVTFDYDSEGKEYLERNLGLRAANRLMGRKIKTWYWEARWFKPLQEEEYSVNVSPSGEIAGFDHTIPEKAKGENLSRSTGRGIVQDFMRSMGIEPAKYRLVTDSSRKLPNRTDHEFTWEERGFKAGEATNRLSISVAGDRVSYFGYFLKLPEKWERKTSREAGQGDFLVTIAGIFSAGLGLALLIVFLFAVRARSIQWRFAVFLAAVLVAVQVAASLNSLPIMRSYYDTNESMGSFLSMQVIGIIMAAIGIALSIFLLGSTGDVMQRQALSERVPVFRLLTRQGLVSKEFVRASLVGFGLGLAQLGYVSAFYVLAMKYFGVWSPADVPYDDTLSTALPWIYPLTIGLMAALTEEFTFRLFAVSFLKRYLKYAWIAVLLPALIWAFLHSNYPQQPPYVRGIEISAVGIVLGLVFLKYGIISTVTAHYTYNAVVAGTLLVRSENLYFRVSGLVVMALMLLPLVPAAIRLVRRVQAEEAEPAAEEPVPAPAAPPADQPSEPETVISYQPMSRRKLRTLALIGLAAAVGAGIWSAREYAWLDHSPMKRVINRKTADRLAERHMRELGVRTGGYMAYSQFDGDPAGLGVTYILRRVGREKTRQLIRRELHDAGWYRRWFKPLKKESYEIWLEPDGRFYSWYHDLEEDAPGARLPAAKARPLAEDWLVRRDVDFSQYRLLNSYSERLEKRTDHWFTWEKKKPKVAKATFRLSVSVQGDEVMSRRYSIKIPDEYRRSEYKRTTRMTVCMGILGLVGLGFAVWGFFLLVMQFAARRQFNWKLSLLLSVVVAGMGLLEWINGLPTFYSGYSDTDPLGRFYAVSIISFVTGLVFSIGGTTLFIAFADLMYRRAFPGRPALAEWFGLKNRLHWRSGAFQEGAVIAYSALGLLWIVSLGHTFVQDRFFQKVLEASENSYSGLLDGLSPILGALPSALEAVIYVPAVVALLVSIARLHVKRSWMIVLLAVGLSLLVVGADARNWLSFAQKGLGIGAGIVLTYLMLVHWFGHNAYAYGVFVVTEALISQAPSLLMASDLALRINGIALLVLGLAPAAAAVYMWRAGNRAIIPTHSLLSL